MLKCLVIELLIRSLTFQVFTGPSQLYRIAQFSIAAVLQMSPRRIKTVNLKNSIMEIREEIEDTWSYVLFYIKTVVPGRLSSWQGREKSLTVWSWGSARGASLCSEDRNTPHAQRLHWLSLSLTEWPFLSSSSIVNNSCLEHLWGQWIFLSTLIFLFESWDFLNFM